MIRIGSLFSGIGGLELGLEHAFRDHGIDAHTTFQVESDEYCQRILMRHWPDATRYGDVRNVVGEPGIADILCGGFPCQDVSYAGKGAGLAGDRSGLWHEFSRLIREIRPRVVVVENVAALRNPRRGGSEVLRDLAACGYDAVWFSLRASDVGAPHRRERLFVVGWERVGDALRGTAQPERVAGIIRDATARTGAETQQRKRRGNSADGAGEAGVADTIGGRRDGRAFGAEGDHGDRTDARRPQGSDGASDGRAELADANARGRGERTSREERAGRTEPDRDDARAAGMANARGSRLERQRNFSVGAHAEDARSRGERGRRAQPVVGRTVDGLPVRLDAHRWPARPGEPQRADEAPRVTTEKAHRNARLKALGNAVVPQCAYVVGCVVASLYRLTEMNQPKTERE